MSQLRHPFDVEPQPGPEEPVAEAFKKMGLTEKQAPTFHAFLLHALKPVGALTPTTVRAYETETRKRLKGIVDDIGLARQKTRPYYARAEDLPEYIMIVASMSSLPYHGYYNFMDMLRTPRHASTMARAHHLHFSMQRIEDEPRMKKSAYWEFDADGRLMTELKACLIARNLIQGFNKGIAHTMLRDGLGVLSHFRSILVNQDSAMARHFRVLDQALTQYVHLLGRKPLTAPIVPGTRLREHARALGFGAPPETPAEPPLPAPADNVVALFSRTRRQPA